MKISIKEVAKENQKARPTDESSLGFGKVFTDYMFTMVYREGQGWHNPVIGPYGPIAIDPAAQCLHYAQEIFEGMKAYRGGDGSIYLFRPFENAKRMNASARRMCMPEVDESFFVEAATQLVLTERAWIPHTKGASLYIRPTMIATEAALGIQVPKEFLFFIVVCPVGAYYPEGLNPVNIYIETEYVRAVKGGTGQTKSGGNYAASIGN